MEGGAIFKVRLKDKEQVLAAFTANNLCKNEVDGYAYNNANMLVTKIERILAKQLFEDSTDGMKGLLGTSQNRLTDYKAHTSASNARTSSRTRRIQQIASSPALVRLSYWKSQQTVRPRKRRIG